MRRLQYFAFMGTLVYHVCCGDSSGPLVETKVGRIRGLRADNGNYSMYLGIPYATVDKHNYFGSAVPHPKFDTVFEAYQDTAVCPQVEDFKRTIIGTLDCLHLSIYVPDSATTTNRLPVLISIHFGGFISGFSARYLYGPKFLVRHDIILVTFNYRVGPYGFMCLNIPEVPGNAGLKDQRLAFKWVKDNVESFNGDPNKITLYGSSAGSIAVDMHYLFGDSNLYDKLIMHSGTSLTPITIRKPDTKAALKLAADLGFETHDNVEALIFLSTVDPHQVIASNQALGINYGLCIEEEFDGVETFVKENPSNVIGPDASEKSVLLAYNRDDVHTPFPMTPLDLLPSFHSVVMDDLQSYFKFDTVALEKFCTIVRHFYIGDESFTEKVRLNLGRYTSDFHIIHPTFRSLKRYTDNGCKSVYHLVFSYRGERNFNKVKNNIRNIDIAVHGDEIGYLFDVSFMNKPSARDQLTIDRITTLWANFVKYGNPSPHPTKLVPVAWKPATKETIPYLELDTEVRVGKRHYHDRVAFWDLFYELNWQAQRDVPTD